MKVRLHFSESDALSQVDALVVERADGSAQRRVVVSLRGKPEEPILRLEGVSTREGAEALTGALLWIERTSLPALVDGEYYLVDLVGCDVFAPDGETRIGRVTGVRPDPSVDTALIALKDGRAVELPLVDAFVGRVDTTGRRLELASEDGLID